MAQPATPETRPATSLLGVLADIADELSSMEDWRTRILNAACLIADHFASSTVSVGLQMKEWEVISCAETADPAKFNRSLLRAHALLIAPPGAPPEVAGIEERAPEAGSSLALPVIGASEIVGVLSVRSTARDAFTPEDVGAMAAAALMIGSFVQSILAHEEEAVAREKRDAIAAQLTEHVHLLQQSLMPRKPEVGQGYRVASAFIPGTAETEVGGDFYDIFETRNGLIGLVIGDVAGKGIPSATLAVATRSTIRAYAYDSSRSVESMTLANSMLSGLDPQSGLFVTVFLAVLDPATGLLAYSCAGHPTPMIWRAKSGETESLPDGDLPVGVMPDVEYREHTSHLDPGDKIVLYTDGISEARCGSSLFGTEGIERVLREHGHLPPDDLLEELLSRARAWSHDHLTDDIALIVLERNPA